MKSAYLWYHLYFGCIYMYDAYSYTYHIEHIDAFTFNILTLSSCTEWTCLTEPHSHRMILASTNAAARWTKGRFDNGQEVLLFGDPVTPRNLRYELKPLCSKCLCIKCQSELKFCSTVIQKDSPLQHPLAVILHIIWLHADCLLRRGDPSPLKGGL